MFTGINNFLFGQNRGLVFKLVLFLSLLLIFMLEWYEQQLWGAVYNASFCTVLAVIILLLSNRPVFSIATTSFVFSSIWIASEIKFQYLHIRLIPSDLYAASLSKEVFIEMVLPETIMFMALVFGLVCLFCKERANRRFNKVNFGAFVLLPITLMGSAHSYKAGALGVKAHSNAVQIFVENSLANFTDFKGNDIFCCMKANREAELFTAQPNILPHIVIVLEESTFIPESIIGYKTSNKFFEGSRRLKVHTVGAGTWVQEISLLHGVPPPKYGDNYYSINLYAPGNLDGRLPVQLSSLGYNTSSIFPLNGSFYAAETLQKELGIKNFIDCDHIKGCAGSWRQPDSIFLDKALSMLKSTKAPQFIFLETMRQHSPHNTNLDFDHTRCAPNLNQKQCSVLLDYSTRQKESIQSLETFLLEVRRLNERVIVVVFGDHIPGDVSRLFSEEGFKNGKRHETFFTIWDSKRGYVTDEALKNLTINTPDISFIDVILSRYLGFESQYISAKTKFLRNCNGEFCDEFNKND